MGHCDSGRGNSSQHSADGWTGSQNRLINIYIKSMTCMHGLSLTRTDLQISLSSESSQNTTL